MRENGEIELEKEFNLNLAGNALPVQSGGYFCGDIFYFCYSRQTQNFVFKTD